MQKIEGALSIVYIGMSAAQSSERVAAFLLQGEQYVCSCRGEEELITLILTNGHSSWEAALHITQLTPPTHMDRVEFASRLLSGLPGGLKAAEDELVVVDDGPPGHLRLRWQGIFTGGALGIQQKLTQYISLRPEPTKGALLHAMLSTLAAEVGAMQSDCEAEEVKRTRLRRELKALLALEGEVKRAADDARTSLSERMISVLNDKKRRIVELDEAIEGRDTAGEVHSSSAEEYPSEEEDQRVGGGNEEAKVEGEGAGGSSSVGGGAGNGGTSERCAIKKEAASHSGNAVKTEGHSLDSLYDLL